MKSLHLSFPRTSLVWIPLLAACQTIPQPLPGPVSYERTPTAEGSLAKGGAAVATSTQIAKLPASVQKRAPEEARPAAPVPVRPGDEELVSIAIEQTPLPTFLQILYGSVLKMPYTLDPAVMSRTDPVTFKSSQPLPRARVAQLAEGLLRSYGLGVEDFDGLVRIGPAASQQSNSVVPVLRSGEAQAQSGERRPVFHYVELQIVKVADMAQWLKLMVGTRVNLQEDANRNAFLLSGGDADVRNAIELIKTMDQPRLRGRSARRFTPANIGAQELGGRLIEVLGAQGYSVALGSTAAASVLVLPVPAIGGVIVFAHNDEVMEHVQRWVLELDRPNQNATSSSPLFTYAVKYADAQELARTLSELLGGGGGNAAPASGQAAPVARSSGGGRVVVNNATNTLIIRGTGPDEQQQIRQLLRELDRPTKSAMIEVVVAELTVGELEKLGIQWSSLDRNGSIFNRSVQFVNGGLNMTYASSARQVLAAINALAVDNKGRILSNPKVMARNGETATISVGKDVPVLTGQQSTISGSSPIGGGVSTGVLQTIQYRNTGVNLKVRPVINSGNRLDLEISQEVSSVAAGETGAGSNPIISNRKIDTKLSLRDGSTVMLGGLISRDTSVTDSGIPLLKDIPGVGALFRNRQNSTNQTELLVMITPYVINDDYEAEEITAALHKTFGDWAADVRTSRTVPRPSIEGAVAGLPDSSRADAQVPGNDAKELGAEPAPPLPAKPAASAPMPETAKAAVGSPDRAVAVEQPSEPKLEFSRPPTASPGSTSGGADKAVPAPGSGASAPTGKTERPVVKDASPDSSAGRGKPVTDPQILEELRKAMQRNK